MSRDPIAGQMDARREWRNAGCPALCPRCGGWDGPQLPFCTDGGDWTHDNTCDVYKFAGDVCVPCGADLDEKATTDQQETR